MTESSSSHGSTSEPDADTDAPDTDRLQVQNPFGVGWGGSWGASWPGVPNGDTLAHHDQVERFDPQPAEPLRPVVGGVELPTASEPFAFPTSIPGRAARSGAPLVWLGALVVLAAVGGLIFWLLDRSPASPETMITEGAATTAETTTAPPVRNTEAEGRLMRMLPPGYPPGSCRPVDLPARATASVDCANNSDPGGPTSATYSLAVDPPALGAALIAAIRPEAIVVCPGTSSHRDRGAVAGTVAQSPGPWRRNATPQSVSGILVCGIQDNVATVAWTDVERMLVSVICSGPSGPTLEQLYLWWSTHS